MRIALSILTIFVSIFYSALATAQVAEFDFDKKTLKIPKTPEGETVHFEYPFTNKGDVPLIIERITVACTCTKFVFPRKPVMPGESGVVKVSFDTKGKIGYQDRTLEVFANVKKSPEKLRFKIMVDNKIKK